MRTKENIKKFLLVNKKKITTFLGISIVVLKISNVLNLSLHL